MFNSFESGDHQMIYTFTISLLIAKQFYLLRPQNFSFQIVSEFIDFLTSCPVGGQGILTPCFVPRGGVLYTMIVPGGGRVFPLQVMSWGFVLGGIVLDEIGNCI